MDLPEIRTEQEALAAVLENGYALRLVPEDLKTKAVCHAAVEEDGTALQWVPEALKTVEICAAAMLDNPDAGQWVPEALQDAVDDAVDARIEENEDVEDAWIEGQLRGYRALRESGSVDPDDPAWLAKAEEWAAEWNAPEPRMDEWIEAYLDGVRFVADRAAQDKMKTPEACMEAVRKDGSALRLVPEDLKTEAVCSDAVEADGMALRFVPEALRTEALCARAVWMAGEAMEFVPEALRDAVQGAVEDAFDECDRVGVSMGPGVETPAELLAAAKALRGASDEEIEKVLASITTPGAGMRIRIPDAPCMSEEPDDGPKP